MKKWQKIALVGAATVLAAVLIVAIHKAGIACANVNKRAGMKIVEANGCIEFWLNRYQTTVQTIASFLLGGAGLYFVVRQISQLIEQNKLISKQLAAHQSELDASYRVACGRAVVAIEQYQTAAYEILVELLKFRQPDPKLSAIDLDQTANLARQGTPAIYEVLRTNEVIADWKALAKEFEDLRHYAIMRRQGFGAADIQQLNFDRKLPQSDDEAEERSLALPESFRAFGTRIDIR